MKKINVQLSSSTKTMFDFETDIAFLNMLSKHPETECCSFCERMHSYCEAGLKIGLKKAISISADGDLRSFTFKVKILKGNSIGKIRSNRCTAGR